MFFSRKPPDDQRLATLERSVFTLRADLDALRTQHERLRGRFYANRGNDSPPRKLTREEILLRVRAGLPPIPTTERPNGDEPA